MEDNDEEEVESAEVKAERERKKRLAEVQAQVQAELEKIRQKEEEFRYILHNINPKIGVIFANFKIWPKCILFIAITFDRFYSFLF